MRPLALEARVLAAVEARRSGSSPEDDFTECKRQWPEPTAARQLAALANRAAGEPIVYIIGLDDKSGAVVDPGPTDPADWWTTMQKQFDEVTPDWLIHLSVPVADGEYVQAIAFDTSRVPYVLKTPTGRDVPMREGTRTRSASRRELLRLLLPSIHTPSGIILSARVTANWRSGPQVEAESKGIPREEMAYFGGNASLFLEHMGPTFVMLPWHGMRGSVRCRDRRFGIRLDPPPNRDYGSVSAHGIEERRDGILATGPGAFQVFIQGEIPLERRGIFVDADHIDLALEFDVVGSSKPVRVDQRLQRYDRFHGPNTDYLQYLGQFELQPGTSGSDLPTESHRSGPYGPAE
jgi:hypothetical protein